jgi:hypothetical protein
VTLVASDCFDKIIYNQVTGASLLRIPANKAYLDLKHARLRK